MDVAMTAVATALILLRRAVYCRDGETRGRLTRIATAWAELAHAVGSLDDTAPRPKSLTRSVMRSGFGRPHPAWAANSADAVQGRPPRGNGMSHL